MEKKLLLILLSAFGLSIVANLLNSKKILTQERKLKKYEKKTLSPNQVITLMSSNPQQLNPLSLGEGKFLIKNIFLKGVLTSKHPLLSSNKKDYLLYKTYVRTPLSSNDSLLKGTFNKDPFNTKKHKVFNESSSIIELFDPTEEIGKKISCLIERDCIRNFPKFCKVTDEKIHQFTKELGFFKKFLVCLDFTLEHFIFCFTKSIWIPGIVIGYKDTELGLKCENPFIVFGDLIYNMKDNKISIHTMCNLISPFESKAGKIISTIVFHRKLSSFLFFSACFFGVTSLLSFDYYRKKESLKKLNFNHRDNIEKRIKQVDPDGLCIICCDNPRSIIFNPCFHLCVCSSCSPKLKTNQCPVCREEIKSKNEIFVEDNFKKN
jgi:hypothetical protein